MKSTKCGAFHPTLLIALKKELAYRVFFYCTAPRAERQHPEAWPASTYRQLREVLVSGPLDGQWALGCLGHSVARHSVAGAIGRLAFGRSTEILGESAEGIFSETHMKLLISFLVCIAVMLQMGTWSLYKHHQLVVKLSCHKVVVVLTEGGDVLISNWEGGFS